MHFVMTSWLLSQIWVTFNLNFFFFFLFSPPNPKQIILPLIYDSVQFHISRAQVSEGTPQRCIFAFSILYISRVKSLFILFFFFSSWEDMSATKRERRGKSQQKSSTVAGCIYIIGIHLERHHGGLMGMRIEVDYRDRTAPLREWNALFMLGFHLKKEKTHTSGKTYVYPRPYVARLSASGPSRWLKGLKRRLKW